MNRRATTTDIDRKAFMRELKKSIDIMRKNGVDPCDKECMVPPATWEKLGRPYSINGVRVRPVGMINENVAIVQRRSKLT